jgi:hypothetical protein
MIIKKVAILLTLFTFGIITQVESNSVKSMNNAANQEMIRKVDENKGAIQKMKGHAKDAIKSSEKLQTRFQPTIPHRDDGLIIGAPELDVNFLRAVKEKKRSPLTECLDKVIFSYDYVQEIWRDKFPNFMGLAEAKSSNPGLRQSPSGSYPIVNKYFEEGRMMETFKLLQFKREEIFKEIFMGFFLSFSPMNGHIFLEMNVTSSSSEKEGGFTLLRRTPKVLKL